MEQEIASGVTTRDDGSDDDDDGWLTHSKFDLSPSPTQVDTRQTQHRRPLSRAELRVSVFSFNVKRPHVGGLQEDSEDGLGREMLADGGDPFDDSFANVRLC